MIYFISVSIFLVLLVKALAFLDEFKEYLNNTENGYIAEPKRLQRNLSEVYAERAAFYHEHTGTIMIQNLETYHLVEWALNHYQNRSLLVTMYCSFMEPLPDNYVSEISPATRHNMQLEYAKRTAKLEEYHKNGGVGFPNWYVREYHDKNPRIVLWRLQEAVIFAKTEIELEQAAKVLCTYRTAPELKRSVTNGVLSQKHFKGLEAVNSSL